VKFLRANPVIAPRLFCDPWWQPSVNQNSLASRSTACGVPPVGLREAMQQPLLFQWGVSTLYGWGIIGLNLLRYWQSVTGAPAYCGGTIDLDSLAGMDPLALRRLMPMLTENSDLRARWPEPIAKTGRFAGIVLHSLGNGLNGTTRPRDGGLMGHTTGAVIFFEDTDLPHAATATDQYAVMIAGSTWNAERLRSAGFAHVATVMQGIEPSVFHPAPASGALAERFAVFSGGKLEFRKGQDLVLMAFRAFAARHREAVLVTAWHSPWPRVAATLNHDPVLAPISLDGEGKADVSAWVAANGLGEDQFIDIGRVPNHLMAPVLREIDVAVFPNRCEGGTNLVAMECMACGIPTIVSDNTGHKDLLATGAPYALTRQAPVPIPDSGTEGWGESDVDEIVETLERAWADREEAHRRGAAGAAAMARWTWSEYVRRYHDVLAPFCR
jgi:glycosyltransferase involved in cell wall biosynthesis